MERAVKPIYLGDRFSGISLEYTKKDRSLYVSGWYDSCVGIEGHQLSLADLCRQCGITPACLRRTASELERGV